jgi:glycerol-3-phosphate dehydrogenase
VKGGGECLAAEVVYAARHEAAFHVADVLVRRTRLSIEARDRGVAAAPVVARLLAAELGWEAERTEREIANYLARVKAERGSQEALDDAGAEASRLGAPDLVPTVTPSGGHGADG